MNRNDQQFMAQKIRTQYMEKESTELDELRELDKKIKRPVNIFSYTVGGLGAIIMGSGMSLVMTSLGTTLGIANPMATGVVIGIVGLCISLLNYPLHKRIMKGQKEKHAKQIIELSDKIVNR